MFFYFDYVIYAEYNKNDYNFIIFKLIDDNCFCINFGIFVPLFILNIDEL